MGPTCLSYSSNCANIVVPVFILLQLPMDVYVIPQLESRLMYRHIKMA